MKIRGKRGRIMSDDAKLVRLSRISLQTLDEDRDDRDASLATDYFDSLEIEHINLTRLHDALLNSGEKGNRLHDISMQTYVIYCFEDHIRKCIDKYKFFAGTDDFYNSFRYISIIQVYITPEALIRAKDTSIIKECEEDLNSIVHFALEAKKNDN